MFSSNTSQVSNDAVFVEDVFSTWLYPGNNSTQTITNGIDLAGKGGLVWTKSRNQAYYHALNDTARGAGNVLQSQATDPSISQGSDGLSAFISNGYSIGSDNGYNTTSVNYVSWTFRKQAKFFDVVTWTGDGNTSKTIPHNLGSVPGCIITKMTSGVNNWQTYHRSLGNTQAVQLNLTNAASTNSGFWNNTSPTATEFTVGTVENAQFETYVAYLFAHDAGGFGLTGTDNVISCGSFTTNGSGNATVNLGYEPQWVMVKASSEVGNWDIIDNMRGFPVTGDDRTLRANLSNAEATLLGYLSPNATGFSIVGSATATYVYIAIRRGPMRTPTTGTSVFNPLARTGTGTNPTVVTTTNNPDLLMSFPRTASPDAYGMCFWDKLRGVTEMLQSWTTSAQTQTTSRTLQGWLNTGYQAGADFIEGYLNYSGSPYVNYPITRAPGFFDVVCYTGTGSNLTLNHNLGVAPELMIIKARNAGSPWAVYAASEGINKTADLNRGDLGFYTETGRWLATPTATQFSVKPGATLNSAGQTQVAYLFASCPGVSKVGTYTGTGAAQTINCGFTGGARFVMIKRTDSTGNWTVFDTARGMTSGNDPFLSFNVATAENTTTNFVDTDSTGFQLTSSAPAALNGSGGTFIYLAIA